MRTLDHENVLKLHEVYESGKYIHLVLEFLSGGELLEKIKKMRKLVTRIQRLKK